MKPLTRKQLEDLEVGDCVWVILDEKDNTLPKNGAYCYIFCKDDNLFVCNSLEDKLFLHYSDYATKWIVYKNKEQAEAKGEIVELPCKVGDTVYAVVYRGQLEIVETSCSAISVINSHSFVIRPTPLRGSYCIFDTYATKEEAERRLEELKGEII